MTIQVKLSGEAFRRFTAFDLLLRRKVWKPTVRKSLILAIAGALCAWKWTDAGMLLLLISMALPCLYLFNFYCSLNRQTQRLGLKEPQYAYTLELAEFGKCLTVSDAKDRKTYPWNKIRLIYRDASAIYLYVSETNAFIIPTECIPTENQDEVWHSLSSCIPAEKLVVISNPCRTLLTLMLR